MICSRLFCGFSFFALKHRTTPILHVGFTQQNKVVDGDVIAVVFAVLFEGKITDIFVQKIRVRTQES